VVAGSFGSDVCGRYARDFLGVSQWLWHISTACRGPSLSRILGRYISALAWGLSVVGTLVWEDFGIVSSIKWDSWFNFFAAGFAATAVGYSAK
jgi:hypothetical protein